MGKNVRCAFIAYAVAFYSLFFAYQTFAQIGSGGNPNSPCYVSVETSPSGILVMQVTYADSSGTNVASINDLGRTPLVNLHVDEGWQKLFIGKKYYQRSSCEPGTVTAIFRLNRFTDISESFGFSMKGIYLHKSFGTEGGSGHQFVFKEPQGIFADIENGVGELFIADTGNKQCHRMICNRNGCSYESYSSTGWSFPGGGIPYGIAVDNSYIYVAGTDEHSYPAILKYNRVSGSYVDKIVVGELPTSLTIDDQNNLYVLHKNANRVSKWTSNLAYISSFGVQGTANGQFQSPQGIAIDNDGNIYVADTGNNRVQAFDKNFNHIKTIKDLGIRRGALDIYSSNDSDSIILNQPKAIAADKQRPGVIYVASRDNSFFYPKWIIYAIDIYASLTGENLISFYEDQVNYAPVPNAMSMGNDNRLYVAGAGEPLINIFKASVSPLGTVTGIIKDELSLEPVQKAVIELKKNNTYTRKDTYKVETDETGTFVIRDLLEGNYSFTVKAVRYPAYNAEIIEITNDITFDAGSILIGPKQPLLSIIKAGTGIGTVTSLDGHISCGSTCSKAYDIESPVVILTAREDPDSVFTGWSGCPNVSGNQCTVAVSDDIDVTATFNLKPCTYTLSTSNVLLPYISSSGSVNITVHSNSGEICNWRADTNAAWITISSETSGTESGTVSYSVSENSGTSSRIGYIMVEGKPIIIRQMAELDKQLDHWFKRKSGNILYGVAYGNGMFVAVGRTGLILTSLDGMSWDTATVPVAKTLFGVTYGNGTFIAVGAEGTAMSSADGITWINRSPGTTTKDINSVAYGNGYFVGAGLGGTILRSPDGITWSGFTSGSADFHSITFGNGKFVVAGSGGTRTSSNGENWSSSSSVSLLAVTYGNGLYAAGNANGSLYKSSTGGAWTVTANVSGMILGITYGNGMFVAVTSYGNVYSSTDGTTWKQRTVSNSGWLTGIVYGNNSFVAVGTSSIMQSDNGLFPIIAATPPDYNYGSSYSWQIFNIANLGSRDLIVGSIAMLGPTASDFTKVDDVCTGNSLQPAESCSIKVGFTPESAGSKSAILSVSSNDPNAPTINVPLSGLAILKGDINGDGNVNIHDAILALQLIAGLNPTDIRADYVDSNTDVDGDKQIGLTEVINIIQIVSELRPLF